MHMEEINNKFMKIKYDENSAIINFKMKYQKKMFMQN